MSDKYSEDFIKALKNHATNDLLTIPKSDLHNHLGRGCRRQWLSMEEALDIFGRYEDYHQTNIADFGLYRREYFALKEYKTHVR